MGTECQFCGNAPITTTAREHINLQIGQYQAMAIDAQRLAKQLQAENEKLKEWYDSIMEFGVNSYYKCGSCGGPVKAGLCCAWCGAKDPQALKGD